MCEHCRNVEKIMALQPERDWSQAKVVILPVKKRFWFPHRLAMPWLWRNVVVAHNYVFLEKTMEIQA